MYVSPVRNIHACTYVDVSQLFEMGWHCLNVHTIESSYHFLTCYRVLWGGKQPLTCSVSKGQRGQGPWQATSLQPYWLIRWCSQGAYTTLDRRFTCHVGSVESAKFAVQTLSSPADHTSLCRGPTWSKTSVQTPAVQSSSRLYPRKARAVKQRSEPPGQ